MAGENENQSGETAEGQEAAVTRTIPSAEEITAAYEAIPAEQRTETYEAYVESIREGLRGRTRSLRPEDQALSEDYARALESIASGEIPPREMLSRLGVNNVGDLIGMPFTMSQGLTRAMSDRAAQILGARRSDGDGLIDNAGELTEEGLNILGNIVPSLWNGWFPDRQRVRISDEEALLIGRQSAAALYRYNSTHAEEEPFKLFGIPIGQWFDNVVHWVQQTVFAPMVSWMANSNIGFFRDMVSEQAGRSAEEVYQAWRAEDEQKRGAGLQEGAAAALEQELRVHSDLDNEQIQRITGIGRRTDNGRPVQARRPMYLSEGAAIDGVVERNENVNIEAANPGSAGSEIEASLANLRNLSAGELAAGGAAVVYGGTVFYGAAEGVARQTVGGQSALVRSRDLAGRAQDALHNAADDANRAHNLNNGSRRLPFERDAASYNARSDARFTESQRLDDLAQRQGTTGSVREANMRGARVGSINFGSAAIDSTALQGNPNWMQRTGNWIVNAPRNLGRVIGDVGGRAIDEVSHHGARLVRAASNLPVVGDIIEWVGPRFAPALGRIAAPVGVALETGGSGLDVYEGVRQGDARRTQRGVVGLSTILAAGTAGAIYGGTAGTFTVPLLGTAVGAAGGFVVGVIGGSLAAMATRPASDAIYDATHRDEHNQEASAPENGDAVAVAALNDEAIASEARARAILAQAERRAAEQARFAILAGRCEIGAVCQDVSNGESVSPRSIERSQFAAVGTAPSLQSA